MSVHYFNFLLCVTVHSCSRQLTMTVRYIDSSLLSNSLSGSRSIVSRGNSLDRKAGRFVTLEGSLWLWFPLN